ncbi:MAG TPA: hypothetical protein VHX59_13580 [Mycobacteriales bacterium]|nr:hypothetical protein [Mycobacteriales bacterium]
MLAQPSIGPGTPGVPPDWARLELDLLRQAQDAAREFVDRYTLADGTLRWRAEWPGIDGSDDAYEAFWTLPLLYLLGGDAELLAIARREWEAVTWQWTQYGQLHREFDASYDWMHHGESSTLFYLLGLADPTSLRERQRAVRFADFYTGADPEAPNYDPARRLIRSPLTGSRGPRFRTTAEDWSTHRSVLDGYPPPFEDIPANPDGTCTWTDDAVFELILRRMNERMTRGDVPLNLTASSLAAHAWLHTGQDRFRHWVLDYNAAWAERTERNNGIIPDNVGPDDTIGQYLDGHWWGGYYGWRWPHGARHILEAVAIGGVAATLVSGETRWLDHFRSQLDTLWDLGQGAGATRMLPNRHGNEGWYDYRQPDPTLPIYCWYLSQDPADLQRVLRTAPPEGWSTPNERIVKGSGAANSAAWFGYLRGDNPDYPVRILEINHRQLTGRLAAIRADDLRQAPEWDIHHWQDRNPVMVEGLVQLMLGAPLNLYHGGLLATTVRYFDPDRRRPGLPPDVAALVDHLDATTVGIQLVNCSTQHEREIVIQAGGFGEHAFTSVDTGVGDTIALTGNRVSVRLGPSCQLRISLGMERFAGDGSYDTPWTDRTGEHPLLQGRSE